jgi:hypothetical protein
LQREYTVYSPLNLYLTAWQKSEIDWEEFMPQMRKLSADEVDQIEQRESRFPSIPPAPEELPLRQYGTPGDATHDASLPLVSRPKIGDLLRLRPIGNNEPPVGIMLELYSDEYGAWSSVEALIDGKRYLVPAAAVEKIVGRPRGVSRIDQPSHRTHGWFVRLYDGHLPRLSRFFSDRTYGGIGAALVAALAFHEAEYQPRTRKSAAQLNGHSNGHTDMNGYSNGHSNGHTDMNGYSNGHSNGHADMNGYSNGHSNGYSNGHAESNGTNGQKSSKRKAKKVS